MGAAKIQVNGQPENVDVYFYITFSKIILGSHFKGRLHKGPIDDKFKYPQKR